MNIWTEQRDYKLITRSEWIKEFEGWKRRNNECHDRYLDMGIMTDDDDLKDYCAGRCSGLSIIVDSNKKMDLRKNIEHGYHLYGLGFDGIPILVPVTEDEVKSVYDKRGNVRLPSYLI